ncbi:MAG TPA: sugar porter family MFS transporter [Terriglobia bacterium]|nr:sugar porter family MFS transporter [Terriglobia bacterium]
MEQRSSLSTGAKASSTQGSASGRATVVLTAMVAALGGLLFGYDTSVISGAMLFLRTDFHLSDVQLEFAVGIALAGALVGSASAGYCTDRWGRRWMLLVTALGFGLFSVLSGLAVGLVSFSVARFFVGACIGMASLAVPLYIAEMAPARIRGALVSLNQLAITVGIGVAYFVDYVFAASESWRWMFASAVFPAVVLLIGMIFLPESPRWLARKGFRDQALENFRRLGRGDEAEAELAEVEAALQQEQEGFGILLQPGFRVAVLVGIGLAIFQQITGINTIIYYSPAILRMSGYPSAKAAILAAAIIGLANVLVTVVSIALVDRLGRRFLLLLSTAGMAVALTLIGVAFYQKAGSMVVFYEVIAYIVSFGIGLGPVMWLLISEIYPTKIRGKAMSLAALSVWGSNWIVAGTFLSLLNHAGPAKTFWLYACLCVAAFIFCYVFVPETKGRSLEAIEHHWRHFGEKPAA